MQPHYDFDNNTYPIALLRRDTAVTLSIDEVEIEARLQWLDQHQGWININGKQHSFSAAQNNRTLYIHLFGRTFEVSCQDMFSDQAGSTQNSGKVAAPMPGVVIETYVDEQQTVAEGEPLLLIESMKLQTEIKATQSGLVSQLRVSPGSNFNKGDLLIDITPDCSDLLTATSEN